MERHPRTGGGENAMFTIYSDNGSGSTMVSNLFIDEYMNSANDAQIKIYLYLLRIIGTKRTASISDLADRFNHTEKDVVRSLRYWERMGLLSLKFSRENELDLISIRLCSPEAGVQDPPPAAAVEYRMAAGGECRTQEQFQAASAVGMEHRQVSLQAGFSAQSRTPAAAPSSDVRSARAAANRNLSFPGTPRRESGGSPCAPDASAPDGGTKKAERRPAFEPSNRNASASDGGTKKALSEAEAIASFRSDPRRAQLLFVIEQYIGKPLSLREIHTIYQISEDLHFSDDLTDYLVQFCVDRGRKNFRDILDTARSWAREDVRTPSQAERFSAKEEAVKAKARQEEAVTKAAARTANPGTDGKPAFTKAASGTAAKAAQGRRRDGGPAGASSPFPSSMQPPPTRRPRTTNAFNQFEQNSYDFNALENELLGV